MPPPSLELPRPMLPEIVLLLTVNVPLLDIAPLPNPPAELPLNVHVATVAVPTFSIAPPVAESLALKRQFETVRSPALLMAPPSSPPLLLKTQSETFNVPPFSWSIPPPRRTKPPLSIVTPDKFTVLVVVILRML